MAVSTFEGIVEAGQMRLLGGEKLPEQTTVYVVVPNVISHALPEYSVSLPSNPRIMSPRVGAETAAHFVMEVAETKR